MAKKKKHQLKKGPARIPPRELLAALDEVHDLVRRKRLIQARDRLQELDRKHPNQPQVVHFLTNVYYDLNDVRGFQAACERLVKLKPDDANFTLMLAGAYLTNLFPVLSLCAYRHFLRRWPNHPRAAEARQTLARLEGTLGRVLEGLKLTGEDALEAAILHEEVQSLLARGLYTEARQKAEVLLRSRPNYTAALNNVSETYFRQGNFAQAIAFAERTLGVDPQNIHALSNMIRYQALSGRWVEARSWTDRLKSSEAEGYHIWTKKAEALSCLGDDLGVAALAHQFQQTVEDKRDQGDAFLYHLFAVAFQRLGQEQEAQRQWREALQLETGFDVARGNLEDLKKPLGERHAPWPFPLHHWLPEKTLTELQRRLASPKMPGEEDAFPRLMTEFLRTHPEFAALMPVLLDRGDEVGRELAFRIARTLKTPELLAALRDFAQGQRGPDRMRSEAAQLASEAGLIPAGPVRLWFQGEWRDILLMGWEVTRDPLSSFQHGSQVQAWMLEGIEAANLGEAVRAERLFKKALEVEPDAPDVLNNLAAAYDAQGRRDEAVRLLLQIHERAPDYLFGIIGMAKLHTDAGEFEKAKALLDKAMARPRLHITEFTALASAQIRYWLAQGKKEAARPWVEMWAQVDPGHAVLKSYRRMVQ